MMARRTTKTFSKARIYGHAVGRIMVHEATLLTWQQVDRLIESDFEEALRVLLETVYGSYLEGAKVARDIERGLHEFLVNEYRFLDEICAGTLVADFMHSKYDFHNLRVVLKEHYFGDFPDELISDLGTVDEERLRKSLEEGEYVKPPEFVEAVVDKVKALGEALEPQAVDTVIDRAFLERRLEIAEAEKSDMLIDFCRAAIDVANCKILLRGRNLEKETGYYELALAEGGKLSRKTILELAGAPYEQLTAKLLDTRYGRMLSGALETGGGKVRLTSLDRATDEYLLDNVQGFSKVSVGPERIVRFMLTRENEVSMLRIIFMGKLHLLSPETIENRLPVTYMKTVSR